MCIEIIDFVEDGEENYSSYGLSPYYGKITLIENNGKKNTVTLGTDKDGKFYALINDSKTVYTISNKDFSFVNADATSFIQSLAYLRNIKHLKPH